MELMSLRLSPLAGCKGGPHPGSADSAASVIARGALGDHTVDAETEAPAEKGLAEVVQ